MAAEIVTLYEKRYDYGECLCGGMQWSLLLDPEDKGNIIKMVGVQCQACETIALFEENQCIEFEFKMDEA